MVSQSGQMIWSDDFNLSTLNLPQNIAEIYKRGR